MTTPDDCFKLFPWYNYKPESMMSIRIGEFNQWVNEQKNEVMKAKWACIKNHHQYLRSKYEELDEAKEPEPKHIEEFKEKK
ncbi:MAG: hypothetical protein LBR15_00640 [Methanobrevibacter sp.]|jgi:hypothetical protein|nr:hypothetical protein [Candidatus Methanovirga australis]